LVDAIGFSSPNLGRSFGQRAAGQSGQPPTRIGHTPRPAAAKSLI
jgi:hypothetical protein